MTGRHPVRVNITDWIPGTSNTGKFKKVEDRDNLALEEVTIAEILKQNGYKTFFAGKLHLGNKGHFPEDQGFDINIGGHHRGSPPGGYYSPWKNPRLTAKSDGEYLTERLTDETSHFIEEQSRGEEPFLVYLSYYKVHTPIQPYKKRVDKYKEQALQEPWRQIVEGDSWYHRSRVMKWPKFGPGEIRMIQPRDGIDGDIEIQAAIDSLPATGGKVRTLGVKGRSRYPISNPSKNPNGECWNGGVLENPYSIIPIIHYSKGI